MATNLSPKNPMINTGVNIMTGTKRSPSLSTLKARSVGDVAPNEDQVLASVEATKVASPEPIVTQEQPQETMDTSVPEVPEVTPDSGVPELLRRPEETLPTEETKDPLGEVVTVDREPIEPNAPVDEEDPFADSISVDHLSTTYALDDEAATSDFLSSDVTGNAYQEEEERTLMETAKAYYENANKISYGLGKAIAGTLDLATAPGWALAHVTLDGAKFPFTGWLEEFYPEKAHQFAEDDNSYADELLRMTQTGAEFIGGGALLTKGATAVSKGAYQTSQKVEALYSGASALGYQGALEMGASEGMALLTGFLAPASPQLIKASYDVSKKSLGATTNVLVAAVDKTTDYLPMVGFVKSGVKSTAKQALQVQKQKLLADDTLWNDTFLKRKARDMVLKTKDTVKSIEEQKAEIASVQRWINAAFPDTPEVRRQVERMKNFQDAINKDLPPDNQIQLTIEQIYGPVYKQANADSGLDEVMRMLRLTNSDAYNAQILQNRKAMLEYLDNNKGTMGSEETQAFKSIFEAEAEDILKLQETIYGMSRNVGLLDPSKASGYSFPEEAVAKELRPALENIEKLLDDSYDAAMKRLPMDAEVDTTVVADAVTNIYNNLGLFSRPESIPPYLKVIVEGLQTNAKVGDTTAAKVNRSILLNTTDELQLKNNELLQRMTEVSLRHKKELSQLTDKKAIKSLELKQKEEMASLKSEHSKLIGARKEASINKRTQLVNESTRVTGVESLPQPNLVTVEDVVKGLKAINIEIRRAKTSGDRDSMSTLLELKTSLDDSLKGLVAVDADAYDFYQATNGHYQRFVSRDFDESMASDITEVRDHLPKIVSEEAVSRLWDNGGWEATARFLRNFDGTREGLGTYLKNIDNIQEDPNTVKAMDLYSKEAERGVQALQDIIYTSLAQKVRVVDADIHLDPVVRMERVKNVLTQFKEQHNSKLVQIPGFETFGEDVNSTLNTLHNYKQALDVLEERRNMSILRDVVGPGKTIQDIVRNDQAAQEMDDFLNNRLPSISVEGLEGTRVQEATASQIRKSLSKAFINEHTKNGVIAYGTLDRLLAEGTRTRNNLVQVLGETEVLKMDAYRYMGRAIDQGEVTFTQVLTENSTLRKLEELGLPLGRVGSLLQRRAVFAPSGAYVAGAVVTKALDAMGNQQTSRAMQLLIERPFDVLHLDQVLLQEMKKLPPVKRKLLDDVLNGSTKHMRELMSWLPKVLGPTLRAHTAYLGYKFSLEEAEQMVADSLKEDTRHPDFNVKEEPTVPYEPIEIRRQEIPEVPELLNRPEEQMEVSDEVIKDQSDRDPLHEVSNHEGVMTDGMSTDEATSAKSKAKFIELRGQGFTKEQVKGIIDSLGMADNNNKVLLLKAVDEAYSAG